MNDNNTNSNKPIRIEGYAVVFNKPSVLLNEKGRKFTEYIHPEACTQDFIDKQDVILCLWHDMDKPLARHHEDGTGNLTLKVDSHGLYFKAEWKAEDIFPDLQTAIQLIKGGVCPGCSFSFFSYPDADDYANRWTKLNDGTWRKDIYAIRSIIDVTIARFPAYPDTSISVNREKGMFYSDSDIHIYEGNIKVDTLRELQYKKTRIDGKIGVLDARESLGLYVDVDERLRLKAESHKLAAEITKRKNQVK